MEQYSQLTELVAQYSLQSVYLATASLFVLTAISLVIKNISEVFKKILFFSFVIVTLACTIFLAGSTIYLNVNSISGGPVHHHADYEIWNCGELLEFEDPHGISNKIGESTVHEHNDNRIHIEGVIVGKLDASLGNFFRATGGKLEKNSLSFPGHHGDEIIQTGDSCQYEENAQLQVFLYKVEGDSFKQTKLADPKNYIISAQQNIPPGDCIIIELDKLKAKTDKLCQSYKTAIETGNLTELKF